MGFDRANVATPPLKWAGGKRWFATKYRHFVPEGFRRYFEPFAGSAALFFAIKPAQAILSDVNPELINLYRVIKEEPARLERALRAHQRQHSKDYYYAQRAMKPRSAVGAAARMLYLNRTCWNGLYRVNTKGQFNVPIGTKDSVVMESDDFELLSGLLSAAELLVSDFEPVIDRAGEGDFVFVDPPYTVAHNQNGFVKYNEQLFSWDDQVRLASAIRRAAARGAQTLITNAAHASIQDLYAGCEQICLSRAGVIAGAATSRGRFDELVIRCL